MVEASTTNKIDNLEGLKENVIIGKLIPAGETYRKQNPDLIKEVATEENTEDNIEQEETITNSLPVI